MQIKEVMWKVGLGSCLSMEIIPAPKGFNKEGSVPSLLINPALGWWLAQQDCAVLESKQSMLLV